MIARFTITALVLAISCQADSLRLKDGSILDGSFLGGTADEIRFLSNDKIQSFSRAEVAAVIFSSSDAPSDRRSVAPETPVVDPGPSVAGAPFLRGASGYIPLEAEIGMMSRGGGMYGMGAPVYRIQGQRSPVRVRQSDRIVFVVRLRSGDDPRQFQLLPLQSRMGYRQTQSAMGGAPAGWPFSINRISDSVYELTPSRGLYPGEYAVSSMNSNQSYCFGVDY